LAKVDKQIITWLRHERRHCGSKGWIFGFCTLHTNSFPTVSVRRLSCLIHERFCTLHDMCCQRHFVVTTFTSALKIASKQEFACIMMYNLDSSPIQTVEKERGETIGLKANTSPLVWD
jgi:hypothetical protein